MTTNPVPASYADDDSVVATGPQGQKVHLELLAHTDRLQQKFWEVTPGVWCFVGNGLSNQTFVKGPEGIIAIDSGESIQEMTAALVQLRKHTSEPIVACIYSHFHYVGGTKAVLREEGTPADVPIWGHERIVPNMQSYGTELSAAGGRGLVHQFGMQLPADGPDGLVNVGLGLAFRLAEHAPFTVGFVPPTHTLNEPVTTTLAGLQVELTPAPSDANDSITIWFPELGVCVNNMVWPTLFNVFAIRGEEYRDPRVLLTGLDHIASLGAEHLVGAHGPPLSGAEQIAHEVTNYSDSIRFLWDQTVRGINRGLTMDELVCFVQLPDRFQDSYFTQQFYGVAEHHVRQIHTGLRGWFDGDEAALFRLPPAQRCTKLIAGFGGPAEVRSQSLAALDGGDLRWALELASWLVRAEVDSRGRADGGSEEDRGLLAQVLRTISQRTTSSNVRDWCLTRALELEGTLDLSRYRTHRIGAGVVMNNPPAVSVSGLKVLVDPAAAAGLTSELRWEFANGDTTGLLLRDQVAIPTSGANATLSVRLDLDTWAKLLSGKAKLSEAIASAAVITNDDAAVKHFFASFDHPTLTL